MKKRILKIVEELRANEIEINASNVQIQSLFSEGGTISEQDAQSVLNDVIVIDKTRSKEAYTVLFDNDTMILNNVKTLKIKITREDYIYSFKKTIVKTKEKSKLIKHFKENNKRDDLFFSTNRGVVENILKL